MIKSKQFIEKEKESKKMNILKCRNSNEIRGFVINYWHNVIFFLFTKAFLQIFWFYYLQSINNFSLLQYDTLNIIDMLTTRLLLLQSYELHFIIYSKENFEIIQIYHKNVIYFK